MNQVGREERIQYRAGTFRLLAYGDHMRCDITGARVRSTSCATGASPARNHTPTPQPASKGNAAPARSGADGC